MGTVFRPIPDFSEGHRCGSIDQESRWCCMVSDCLSQYEIICNSWDHPGQVYCKWPRDGKGEVEYEQYKDQFLDNLRNTDGTVDCAFQDDKYLCYVHVGGNKEWDRLGFGCVVDKHTGDLRFVELGEDDGNYWGDHDIEVQDVGPYQIALVAAVVGDLPSSDFWDKEALMEKLFMLNKR